MGVLALAGALISCSPTDRGTILRELRTQLTPAYHECVPLGWNPVPVDGSYVRGYGVELDETWWYLPPLWTGKVLTRELRKPEARVTFELLNDLARAGLVQRRQVSDGYLYHVTPSGFDYYFDDDQFGNNPQHEPYLCYSTMVAQRVTWVGTIRLETRQFEARRLPTFRAAFEWQPSADADWAADPFVRSHGVVLGPSRSPTVATFVKFDSSWELVDLSQARTDRLANPSVWPTAGWIP